MNDALADRRRLAALFASGALLMLAILLAHPHERALSFADLVDSEIRLRVVNAVVHGGAILPLVLLVSAQLALARLCGAASLAATIAVVAFGSGCALMTGSLVLVGFVTPALAVQSRAAQDVALQQLIQTQMQFCAICIRTLMPLALLAFAGSAVCWFAPLARAGRRARLVGAVNAATGVLLGALILAAPPQALSHVLLGGLLLLALWQLALAWVVLERPTP